MQAKSSSTKWLTKLLGGGLALLGVFAGVYGLWRFGPKPNASPQAQVTASPTPAMSSSTGATQHAGIVPFAPQALAANRHTPLHSGRDSRPVAEYVQVLERLYQQRGYQQVRYDVQQPEKPPAFPAGAMKLYWVSSTEEFHLLTAFGVDANLQGSKPASQPETVVTLVKAGERETQWETYRFSADQAGTQPSVPSAVGPTDSGQDPPGIPKHQTLQRILSFNAEGGIADDLTTIYSSQATAESLRRWYQQQMPASGWQFNPTNTDGAQQVMDGTLCFTRDEQLCLVWIGSDEECHCTSIIISVKQLTKAE